MSSYISFPSINSFVEPMTTLSQINTSAEEQNSSHSYQQADTSSQILLGKEPDMIDQEILSKVSTFDLLMNSGHFSLLESDSSFFLELSKNLKDIHAFFPVCFCENFKLKELVVFNFFVLLIRYPVMQEFIPLNMLKMYPKDSHYAALQEQVDQALSHPKLKEIQNWLKALKILMDLARSRGRDYDLPIRDFISFNDEKWRCSEERRLEALKELCAIWEFYNKSLSENFEIIEACCQSIKEHIKNSIEGTLDIYRKASKKCGSGQFCYVAKSKIKLSHQGEIEQVLRQIHFFISSCQRKISLVSLGFQQMNTKGLQSIDGWFKVIEQQIEICCKQSDNKIFDIFPKLASSTSLDHIFSKEVSTLQSVCNEAIYNDFIYKLACLSTHIDFSKIWLQYLRSIRNPVGLKQQDDDLSASIGTANNCSNDNAAKPISSPNWVMQIDEVDSLLSWICPSKLNKKKRKKNPKQLDNSSSSSTAPSTLSPPKSSKSLPIFSSENYVDHIRTKLSQILKSEFGQLAGIEKGFNVLFEVWESVFQDIRQHPLNFQNENQNLKSQDITQLHIYQKEIQDHAFMALCGFHVFVQAVLKGDWQALGVSVPMLIIDWHVQIEQFVKGCYFTQHKKVLHKHDLMDLVKDFDGWTEWPNSIRDHQRLHRLGLIWGRYPHTSKLWYEDRSIALPQPLKWILVADELTQKKWSQIIREQDVEHLQGLIQYVIQAQIDSWSFLSHILKGNDPKQDISANLLQEGIGFMRDLKSWMPDSIKRFNGKKFATASFDSCYSQEISDLNKFFISQEQQIKAKMGDSQPYSLQDACIHLSRLRLAASLMAAYPQQEFMAWHHRNVLGGAQWGIELMSISHCLANGLEFVQSHDFQFFQQLLYPQGLESPLVDQYQVFNVGTGFHYPRRSQSKPHDQVQQLCRYLDDCQSLSKNMAQTSKSQEDKLRKNQLNILDLLQKSIRPIDFETKGLLKAIARPEGIRV